MVTGMLNSVPRTAPGRPKSSAAASHEAIIDAVYAILQEKPARDLTIEEVAKRAKVGKPTIYKWWTTKAALVMDMFAERVVHRFDVPKSLTAEESIRLQVGELIWLGNEFFGKVLSDIIAEGQSDPTVLEAYRDRYLNSRRAISTEIIERAYARGEFKRRVEPEVLIDMIYGPIYYRMLVRHQPLDQAFGEHLLCHIMAYLKGG